MPPLRSGDAFPTDPLCRPRGSHTDLTGRWAGSFRIQRQLGAGGLSSVWLAEHPRIGSRVAIKVLHPQLCESLEERERFLVEAQVVNRVQSPHIVRVLDFGRLDDGRDYAMMELLEGETLGDRLARQGQLSWRELRPIAVQVARGLQAAHRSGVLHRDLKPDNIFLCGGEDQVLVKILDFGIAKVLDQHIEADAHGGDDALGTALYAPPEQSAGELIGPEADVYAFGVVLFEALTGCPPGHAPLGAGVPPVVAGLIESMLAPRPEQRPASMTPVLDRLEEIVGDAAAWGGSTWTVGDATGPGRRGEPPAAGQQADGTTTSSSRVWLWWLLLGLALGTGVMASAWLALAR